MGILISILTSRFVLRLLPLAIAACLIAVFWSNLLRILGVGVALLISLAAILIWAIWRRRLPFLRHWNRWLGAIAFAAALLGILAFFYPENGVLSEVSLGGDWGRVIKAEESSTIIGGLQIVGLAIVGIAFIGPRFTWRQLRNLAKIVVTASQQLAEWGQRFYKWLREFYSQHPVHEIIINWIKVRRSPAKEEGIPLIPPQQEIKPMLGIEPVPEVKVAPVKATREVPKVESTPLPIWMGDWQLPPIDMLEETVEAELSQAELDRRAKIIEDALASYGVEAKVVQKNIGPAVTQFGVEPGWDRKFKEIKEKDKNGSIKIRVEEVSRTRVKVERITSLDKDLALALSAPSIRIEAPVPGKPIVGIEVPNSSMTLVSLRELMESTTYQKLASKSKLVLALGKGASSEVVVGDLAKMPHLLIAGTTGSGKTVCLDSIITALLMKNTPEELQFIMIDPKQVELKVFNGVPHLKMPVITESEKTVDILKWLIQEMESRFRKLAQIRGVHDIKMYNHSNKIEKPMPYLVLIIDELADLMMAKSDEVEPRLCRLAQMGRAVGIHLVVATQRPSVNVVTGLIKANFPTRISFKVPSQVDSRTILDTMGAEKLLGSGDLLYLPQDIDKPKRLQGCYTSPEERESLVDFWSEQSRTQLAKAIDYTTEGDNAEDPLLEEAKRLAREHTQISISFLQRKLRIGNQRAEKLMEQLKEKDTSQYEEN